MRLGGTEKTLSSKWGVFLRDEFSFLNVTFIRLLVTISLFLLASGISLPPWTVLRRLMLSMALACWFSRSYIWSLWKLFCWKMFVWALLSFPAFLTSCSVIFRSLIRSSSSYILRRDLKLLYLFFSFNSFLRQVTFSDTLSIADNSFWRFSKRCLRP